MDEGVNSPEAHPVAGTDYNLPPIDLLTSSLPDSKSTNDAILLDRNARLLENVLDAFKVQATITTVRPGPVVTLYELQPAPGAKASSVIALADDIARSMSAISARVALIPGRNVIGIELANARREPVNLHDLVGSETFEDTTGSLPIILGKNVAGDPATVDLASMPHLLVAGTTGSGKSVGLNCMILSLLYRLTPAECRMIMIDPKKLELTFYDDIPHLLSPVVTDPAKAVRALKWAVEQMEDRYRQMSFVGVRSLAGFNEKVKAARVKGQPLGRRVQTGYHPETGQPVFEEELEYDALPQIVVIIDELAEILEALTDRTDLELALHRLAGRGAAGGVHMILTSSLWEAEHLDELVGAEGACRLAYQMADDDAEAFLGVQPPLRVAHRGDMLYLSKNSVPSRIHGAFVSDDEVRRVADYWRAQGPPDYIASIAQEPGGVCASEAPLAEANPSNERQYRQATQLVCESHNASTSWLQRQLRIGYAQSARLIERMERDGIVGPPDHVGRRQVLRGQDGGAGSHHPAPAPRRWWSRF